MASPLFFFAFAAITFYGYYYDYDIIEIQNINNYAVIISTSDGDFFKKTLD